MHRGIGDAVAEQLICMVNRSTRRAFIPLLFANVLCCLLLHRQIETSSLVVWVLAATAAVLLRIGVLGRLSSDQHLPAKTRLSIVAALSILTGSAYGSLLLFFPALDAFERAMLTATLVGICSGATITNAGYRPLFLCFTVPILGALACSWLVNPGDLVASHVATTIGLLCLLMIVTLAIMGQETFDAFVVSVRAADKEKALSRELARALEAAERAKQRAEISSETKTRFLSAASHDLRQPVHVLALYGGMLEKAPVDATTRTVIKDLNTAVDSLSSQLDTLLDLSRLDADAVRPHRSTIDLCAVLGMLEPDFRKLASSKGLAFVNSVKAPVPVWTDPAMLAQIIRNLCGNALKYTFRGRVEVAVTECDANWITLSIIDTGVGIPAEASKRVFEEFVQLSPIGHEPGKGLGLGLSIVKRLAAKLEHPIELTSIPEVGTTVALSLPRRDPVVVPTSTRVRDAPPAVLDLPDGLSVLVVDDDPSRRKSLRLALARYGCRVATASTVSEVRRMLDKAPPDLMLVDQKLTGKYRGPDVIELGRARNARLPIAVVTSEFPLEPGFTRRFPDVHVLQRPVRDTTLLRILNIMLEPHEESGEKRAKSQGFDIEQNPTDQTKTKTKTETETETKTKTKTETETEKHTTRRATYLDA